MEEERTTTTTTTKATATPTTINSNNSTTRRHLQRHNQQQQQQQTCVSPSSSSCCDPNKQTQHHDKQQQQQQQQSRWNYSYSILNGREAFWLFIQEIWISTDLLFQSRLTWLLVLGPVALLGDATGMLGEAVCFTCSGFALIPCAERLSFVTEQVAFHTNGTIGSLLNATFGNAPELLISLAALRSGFYRVVQLAMLGSMLTNLLFVFGLGCLIGGMRWHVQELRITSGNVSLLLLWVATVGSSLPAALALSGQIILHSNNNNLSSPQQQPKRHFTSIDYDSASLTLCRWNAAVMMALYVAYLFFQLRTHKEEFDEDHVVVETPQHLLLMAPNYTNKNQQKRQQQQQAAIEMTQQSHHHYSTAGSIGRRQVGPLFSSDYQRQHGGSRGGSVVDEHSELSSGDSNSDASSLQFLLDWNHYNNNHSSTQHQQKQPQQLPLHQQDYSPNLNSTMRMTTQMSPLSHPLEGAADGPFEGPDTLQPSPSATTTNTNESSSLPGNMIRKRNHHHAHNNNNQRQNASSLYRRMSHSLDGHLAKLRNMDEDDEEQQDWERRRLLQFPPPRPQGTKREKSHSSMIYRPNVNSPPHGSKGNPNNNSLSSSSAEQQQQRGDSGNRHKEEPQMSFCVGIMWLFVITLCISAMSDILVDTIDGFATRCHLSQVFTSMVIVPFFSNVAEQVSAILFAYRNEMDLCVGVTVGSAIQIACFVLPGCVLMGMMVDRSMSLYFRGYETCCLILAVSVVATVLQGGTTNWLVGVTLVGIYTMIAAGFWFHEIEDLSIDAEIQFHAAANATRL